jgi:hypothetical protein
MGRPPGCATARASPISPSCSSILASRSTSVSWTLGFGAVLEQADQAGDGHAQTYSRSLHLLHVDGDRIVRHVLYCTGQWDRPTVERQALEAPVYET